MGNPWAYDFSAIGARSAPLLAIVGGDGEAIASKTRAGFRLGGNSDVFQLIPETVPFDQLNMSPQFLRAQGRPAPGQYECVLNLVTDPDQHPQTLLRIRKLLRGYRGRVINRPEAVMRTTRDQVATLLSGIAGLHVPRVLRLRGGSPDAAASAVERAGLEFPLIVRLAGTHTGQIVCLADGIDHLRSALSDEGTYFATEFVDLRGADGLFRKYRVYFFGQRMVYRNLYLSDQWNVHSKDHRRLIAERPDVLGQLKAMFTTSEGNFSDSVTAILREVRKHMPLDFFGVDFGFDRDGQAVLFEANATMSIVPSWSDVQFKPFLPPALQAVREMLAGPEGLANA